MMTYCLFSGFCFSISLTTRIGNFQNVQTTEFTKVSKRLPRVQGKLDKTWILGRSLAVGLLFSNEQFQKSFVYLMFLHFSCVYLLLKIIWFMRWDENIEVQNDIFENRLSIMHIKFMKGETVSKTSRIW